MNDISFSYTAGRTGTGKTYAAVARAAAIFNAGHGGLYLDPHRDGVELLKAHLHNRTDVWEIDLCDPRLQRQAGWNLFSMERCSRADIEARVSAVVTSFAATLGWGEGVAPRALMLTTMAAQALCELALVLPADLAPTIFQMLPLLADPEWRDTVLPHVSPHVRAFFEQRFQRLDPRAITVVTNVIDRMRSSPTLAALLGQSRSSYNIRSAMDTGRVVLWSTSTEDAWANLVACLVTQDLFRAAMSRRDLPPARRRPYFVWADELQRISGTGSGTTGQAIARALEEARKMGLRLHLMSQQPARLARPTWDAITTNRSMLATHRIGADSADTLAKEWGGAVKPATITRLPGHDFLAQVTIDGRVTQPFAVRGFDLSTEEPWRSWRNAADASQLEGCIDANLRRRPVAQVLSDLDTLDQRILDHLDGPSRGPRTGPHPGGHRRAEASVRYRASGHLVPVDAPDPQNTTQREER